MNKCSQPIKALGHHSQAVVTLAITSRQTHIQFVLNICNICQKILNLVQSFLLAPLIDISWIRRSLVTSAPEGIFPPSILESSCSDIVTKYPDQTTEEKNVL
jgi:hypothetical protein